MPNGERKILTKNKKMFKKTFLNEEKQFMQHKIQICSYITGCMTTYRNETFWKYIYYKDINEYL